MSDLNDENTSRPGGARSIPVIDAVGMMLAHDVTEIRKDEFKGAAFRKGHIIRLEDIDHLRRIGKEHLFVLSLGPEDVHEDEAAVRLAAALIGEGVRPEAHPHEGKINIESIRDGLLTVNRAALLSINMLGDVICSTRHTNTVVKQNRTVAAARAIPLVANRGVVDRAIAIANDARMSGRPVIEVREIRKPRAGIVITGNEVYSGRIKDAFAPVIAKKIEALGGEVLAVYYAPDDAHFIESRLRELITAGADFLIATGGMSVDPDDVTRHAIASLGAVEMCYGSPVLPGSMVLVGYIRNAECGMRSAEKTKVEPIVNEKSGVRQAESRTDGPFVSQSELRTPHSALIPILGIPACGMYHRITVIDLILPRLLTGEKIGRRELAELGHGGLCLQCKECRYPVCPFGT